MLEPYFYLSSLLLSLSCLFICDLKWKLAFFFDARRAFTTIGIGVTIFIIWDLLGISLGIFSEGGSPYTTGISLVPEFPLEELFFLLLLNYTALLSWRVMERVC